VGMSKMASYFKFCSAVIKRAWEIAWAVVIERSIRALFRDLVILVIAVFSLWEMREYLERIHALPEHDNLLSETLIWATLVAAATITIFAATFVFCAIFIAPFRLYQEQIEKAPALSQAESNRLPPQIEICSKSGGPYEISEIIKGRVRSAVRIGIRNSGGSPLSNCRVYIEGVSPPPAHVGLFPALLNGGSFVLRHDDPEKLIDIAVYFDHLKKYKFATPIGGLIAAETLNYIDEMEQRSFVVKVAATECSKSAMFKILVDETKKLRLRYIGDAG
jgi:hypothetical protein